MLPSIRSILFSTIFHVLFFKIKVKITVDDNTPRNIFDVQGQEMHWLIFAFIPL